MRQVTWMGTLCGVGVCGMLAGACGGDDTGDGTTTSTTATTATTTATGTTTGGGGEGGAGGATSSTTTATTTATTTGAGGGGGVGGEGSGGGGGAGGGEATLNGCTEAMAQDFGLNGVDITFPGFVYTPKCVKVSVGGSVSFTGNFLAHPLRGGEIVGVTKVPDPNSPITATGPVPDPGTVKFSNLQAGTYGFYCDVHGPGGMNGAIYVVP